MKSVRDKAKGDSEKQLDKKEKIPYVGISENVFVPNNEIKIEDIGQEIGKNINQHISKLSKKSNDELNSILENVLKEKNSFERKTNAALGGKDYERINMVYSGFDILLSAINEEIQKRDKANFEIKE
ncbi:MAG: hypothetical protein K8Q89_09515 [Nitrosarchaeum sp.]|nr:hypothetical protein [Nitrosarchaeum sp.]